ncbi:hypothetical protein [Halomicrobium salinisoli]|uniref:hypothetical protein n=1 Tax=Halomicrobium salinisoli TaxID=2878391 RepID=UPI001CF00CE0|nr:hypothetical protein [Halomicrobium salinisoli]
MTDPRSLDVHPNQRINRDLTVPPIFGPILEEIPEVDGLLARTARHAECRVCPADAEFAISVPGDVVPLCSEHSGRDET